MDGAALMTLVPRVNAAIALVSCPFALYEALSKKAGVADIKGQLDLCADQLVAALVGTVEESLIPYWPRSITTIILEPAMSVQLTPGLSEVARDALTKCLLKAEPSFKRLALIRLLASRVFFFDRLLYWLIFATAVLSCIILALFVFSSSSSELLAKYELLIPGGLLGLSLVTAGIRQFFIQACEGQIIQE